MPKKLTTEDFIKKAKVIHGDRYGYEDVVYKGSKENIEMTCVDHGAFTQTPSNHLKGRGCKYCGGSAPIKFDDFVERANLLHKNRYSYDAKSFRNMTQKTKIYCKSHGNYWQEPHVHLRPNGCKKCATEDNFLSTKEDRKASFILSLRNKFANKITFEGFEYNNIHSELAFSCVYHGNFTATAAAVVNSTHGCAECYKAVRLEETSYFESNDALVSWVENQKENNALLRNYKFKLQQRNSKQASLLGTCEKPQHQAYSFTLNRIGKRSLLHCRLCVIDRRNRAVRDAYNLKREEFEAVWKQSISDIYGDFYDLSLVEYVNARDQINVGCPTHGYFDTTPDRLLVGGCRACANAELKGLYSEYYFQKYPEKRQQLAEIYYLKLKIADVVFYKIGITKGQTKDRHSMLNTCEELSWEILHISSCALYAAWKLEEEIQRQYGDFNRIIIQLSQEEIRRIRLGPSECFGLPLNDYWLKKLSSV